MFIPDLQALRLEASQKLAAEREALDASKREVEARVQALMGKEYGMVKVSSSRPSCFLSFLRSPALPSHSSASLK